MSDEALDRAEVEAASGAGVRILVFDSGVDMAHPVFADRSLGCWRVSAAAETAGPAGQEVELRVEERACGDAFGHGTAVAGILVQHAPGAQIDSLAVIDGDLAASSERVLHGLGWAVEQGYDIVTCSFGRTESRLMAAFKAIVDRAWCANLLIVSAASVAGPPHLSMPASFHAVLSTDRAPLEGLTIERRRGSLVEFRAAGVDVRVPWKGGGHKIVSGSSYAAPHLAALAARIRELRPTWNACEVKTALYRLAVGSVTAP